MNVKRQDAALLGKKILVTRAANQAKEMADRIRYYGGEPVFAQVIAYRPAQGTEAECEAWNKAVREAEWVILTSQNALDFFICQTDPNILGKLKWACVGKKTAERLASYGFQADFLPARFTADSLAQSFAVNVQRPCRAVVPMGSLSDGHWLEPLRRANIHLTERVLYETVACTSERENLEAAVRQGTLDVLTFASPSAVSFFTELLEDKDWHAAFAHCLVAAIGPSTGREIEKIGYFPEVIPVQHTAQALVDALASFYSK